MNYAASLRYLDSFDNLEKLHQYPRNRLRNLDRMRYLLEISGHPEKSFFPVLIAGTKGKGSTGFFLESILRAANIKTGFYCSPHLQTPRERIRIGGGWVSRGRWAQGLRLIKDQLARHPAPRDLGRVTYFEVMTLLAILIFKQAGVKIGIFEVGMGGRLDATNVLDAPLVILTTIGMDHEAFLGDSLEKIAGEKAAVIRPRAHVVTSPQKPAALRVIQGKIRREEARLYPARPLTDTVGLDGDYQKINASAAVTAARILRKNFGFTIPATAARKGLARRDWPGRAERLTGKPGFVLDVAHNPSAVRALTDYTRKAYAGKRVMAIFGTSRDKKSGKMLQALSRGIREVVITKAANPRSQQITPLLNQARGRFDAIYPAGNPRDAIALARKLADQNTVVIVAGSFYLAGEARDILRGKVL